MHNLYIIKYYFIRKLNKNIIDKLDRNTRIIFRNYDKKINVESLVKLKEYCKKNNKKLYLSNNFKLAIRLDLDGAYIPSFNKNYNHLSFAIKKKFEIIGSAHNIKEIAIKEKQKVSKIFISSLFKRNKNYLGFYKFLKLKKLTKKIVIPLGGISKKNKKKLKLLDCKGFSGIGYFEQKKRPYY